MELITGSTTRNSNKGGKESGFKGNNVKGTP